MKQKVEKKNRVIWAYALLLVITAIAYEPVRNNDFVDYDDNKYVTDNQNVQGGLTTKSFIWVFKSNLASNWHPLTWLSHILDCQLFGLKPFWHHLENLLFHIANTLLLFFIFQKMTLQLWPSLFIAAAFALHPLHVESVAWVAERKDLLSTFWWMLTVIAYLIYIEKSKLKWYLLMVLFYALGLLSKPMIVTLPFVLVLLDYWPLNRIKGIRAAKANLKSLQQSSEINEKPILSLIIEKIPLFIMAAASSAVTFIIQHKSGSTTMAGDLSIGFRISNACVGYVKYIAKMFYPSDLAVLYPIQKIPVWQVVISLSILIIITALCVYLGRNRPYLIMGWLWYFGMLVPVIGLVQVGAQSMADRYSYLPLVGIFIMIGWGLYEILFRLNQEKIFAGFCLIVSLALIICTRNQLGYWRDGISLYDHAIKLTKDNHIIRGNYGRLLVEKGQIYRGITEYKEVLRIKPDDLVASFNMATAYKDLGKLDEAIVMVEKLAKQNPEVPNIHMTLGLYYLEKENYKDAIECFLRVAEISPDNIDAVNNLGIAYAKIGEMNEALSYFRKILKTNPQHIPAVTNLRLILLSQGRDEEAVAELKDIFARCPMNMAALGELAWILATSSNRKARNPQEAIELATKGCNMTNYSDPKFLDVLGAAYAASGNFAEAVTMAEKSLNIAAASNQIELTKAISKRLNLYKNNQIYVEAITSIK